MGETFFLPAQFVATTVFAILLNITANKLPPKWADPLLRWGWFGVLLYFTYLLMSIDSIQRKLIPLAGSPFRSYVVAGLIGLLLALLYWTSIMRVHDRLIATTNGRESQSQNIADPSGDTPTITEPTPQKPTVLSTPAVDTQLPRTSQPKTEAPRVPKVEPRPQTKSTVNQTMRNSPGAIQAGGDVTIGERPPTATPTPDKDRKP